MSEIDEKSKLEKITKFLEKGGTMLANHHECGAPMFRFQGKIICPVCEGGETETRTAKTRTEIKPLGIEPGIEQEKRSQERRPEPGKKAINSKVIILTQDRILWDNVMNKIMNMAESLDQEQDLQRVRDKLACIELGIKILRMLENPS